MAAVKDISADRLALDREKFEHERARFNGDKYSLLMDTVRYLNGIQDDDEYTIESGIETTTYKRKGRFLNGLEESVYEAALISLRKMLQ